MQEQQVPDETVTRVPDIMGKGQAIAFMGITTQQFATMLKNDEIPTHTFNNGRMEHEVYYRVELEKAKELYAETLKKRQEQNTDQGNRLAVYNLSKATRQDSKEALESSRRIETNVDNLRTAVQGVQGALTDLRTRIDDIRSTVNRNQLLTERLIRELTTDERSGK